MGYTGPPVYQEPSATMEIGDGCIAFIGKLLAWLVFLALIGVAIAAIWIK